MKTICKCSKVVIAVVVIFTLLGMYFTAGKKKEEKSNFGYTSVLQNTAVTYVNEYDFSFETPKSWNRFFSDTKGDVRGQMSKNGLLFLGLSQSSNQAIELTVNAFSADDLENEFKHYVETPSNGYKEVTDVEYGSFSVGENEFLSAIYKRYSPSWAEHDIVLSYAAVVDGNVICFTDYIMYAKDFNFEDGKKELLSVFEDYTETFSLGERQDARSSKNKNTGGIAALTFSAWVLLLPLIFILIADGQIATNSLRWQEDILDLKSSKSLLGFLAVCIVLHHTVQKVGAANAVGLGFLENFGVCFVGGFFFCSGYGLMKSFATKKNYLDGFFKKRMPAILVPFYVCNIIFVITEVIANGLPDPKKLIGWLMGWTLLNTQMWYIVEIALFYIIFYVVFKNIKNRKAALSVMMLLLSAFTVGSLLLGHGDRWFQGEWWFNSSLMFGVGMIWCSGEDRLQKAIRRFYLPVLAVVAAAFVVLLKVTNYMLDTYGYWSETESGMGYADKFRCLAAQLPMVFFFVLLICVLAQKVKFQNKALEFFGAISFELYLIHNLFLTYFPGIVGAGALFVFVLVCGIVSAVIINRLDQWILFKLFKARKPQKMNVRKWLRNKISVLGLAIRLELRSMKSHPKRVAVKVVRYVIILAVTAFTMFPIVVMFINSTRSSSQIVGNGISFIPGGMVAENFAKFFTSTETAGVISLLRCIRNSIIIATGYCLFATYFGAMTAYGFETYKFKGKKQLWAVIIPAMMIPNHAAIIGFMKIVKTLGLIDSYIPLIIPAIATPSVVYFIRLYLQMVPLGEIVEAARIDGCGEFGIFNRIILPTIKPAVAIQMIMTFVTCWNNSLSPNMLLVDPAKKTIASYMQLFVGEKSASYNPDTYVALLLSSVPTMAIYILCSRYIVSGITLGAVKE